MSAHICIYSVLLYIIFLSGSPAIWTHILSSHCKRTLMTELAPLPLFLWLSAGGKFTDYLIAHAVQYNHSLKALGTPKVQVWNLLSCAIWDKIRQRIPAICCIWSRKPINMEMSGLCWFSCARKVSCCWRKRINDRVAWRSGRRVATWSWLYFL